MVDDGLVDAYVADRKHLRWWESLKVPASRLGYGASDWLSQLVKLVENKGEAVLVVTDEEEPPWPAYTGGVANIIEMLRGCRYFEYMIAAPDGSWVVFDTHMNELVSIDNP